MEITTRTGLVVGKMNPMHEGHLYVINKACELCDIVYVVVCEDPVHGYNKIPNVFNKKVVVIQYPINKDLAYSYEDTDNKVSRDWAFALGSILPRIDIIFSSEIYGINFARHLGAEHYMVDTGRISYPISSSIIREDIIRNWDYLAPFEKDRRTKTFIITGTESVGKSTLFEALKGYFPNFGFVPEVGREMVTTTSEECSVELLKEIALEHGRRYKVQQALRPPAIIMDTDFTTTKRYCDFLHRQVLDVPDWVMEGHEDWYYIYIDKNAGDFYVQDGTRLSKERRDNLDMYHFTTYCKFKNFQNMLTVNPASIANHIQQIINKI